MALGNQGVTNTTDTDTDIFYVWGLLSRWMWDSLRLTSKSRLSKHKVLPVDEVGRIEYSYPWCTLGTTCMPDCLKRIHCNVISLGHNAEWFTTHMYTHISSEQHCYLPPKCTTFLVQTQPSTHISTITMVCVIMCTVYLLWLRWWWCAGLCSTLWISWWNLITHCLEISTQ